MPRDSSKAEDVVARMRSRRGFSVESLEMAANLDPEFMAIYDAFSDAARGYSRPTSLPPKTRELVLVAMLASLGNEEGTRVHIAAALKAAATQDEILDVLKLCCLTAGAPAFLMGCRALHAHLTEGPEVRVSP
ncbi:MAG: carboxymuconolactone decarboxylase family protein [Chloroflexi bacterium]|nr:carboxymuconolactone decarboxylase family protein [Chloroflexota bacterium]